MITKISGGTVITGGREFVSDVYIEDGKILAVTTDSLAYDEEISAQGKYVAPAFIDIHIHGAKNCDFLDNTPEAFATVAREVVKHGAGTIIPTITSASRDETIECVKTFESIRECDFGGANMPGVHLEGPYFSPKQCGAQEPDKIRDFTPDEYNAVLGASKYVMRWSAAPELDGMEGFAKAMREHGALPAIGHSDAETDVCEAAFKEGFTHVTHLYSCTSMVHRRNAYRYAGIVEYAYLNDDMTVEIIADGKHLPADLLKLIYKIKGREKIAIITDSIRAAGMGEGKFKIGSLTDGMEIDVFDGVAFLADRSAFAGSVAFCDRLVRNMVNLANVPLADAVYMATATPAKIMKLDTKGALAEGYDADVVIFDKDVNVDKTIVRGKVVYSA